MSKTISNKKYSIVALLGIIIPILLLIVMPPAASALQFKSNINDELKSFYGDTLSYGNGCGDIYVYPNASKMSKVIPQAYWDNPPSDNYIPSAFTVIPMYGYMSERGIAKEQIKFYSKDDKSIDSWSEPFILRSLRDNSLLIVWYDEEQASPQELEMLKTIVERTDHKILALPWLKFEKDSLPMDRAFAFNAFGASQSCSNFNVTTMSKFFTFASDMKLRGEGLPEIAEFNKNGVLEELVY